MPPSWDPSNDMPNLDGKVAVVTGGTNGIGLSTVKLLLLGGAKVYLAARSETKAADAIKTMLAENPEIKKDQVVWLRLNLEDLKSVTAAAEELKSKESKVDILSKLTQIKSGNESVYALHSDKVDAVNNAGIGTMSDEKSEDGWEMHMAVNHVGHFVFTNGLLPLLKRAASQGGADVRVVTVSSNAHTNMVPSNYEFHFDSPEFLEEPVSYYPWQWRYLIRHMFITDLHRYGLSKIANIMFAQELQQRLDNQQLPILSISIHPGAVATSGAFNSLAGVLRTILRPAFVSADHGAATSLFAATANEVRENPDIYKGRYLEPVGIVVEPHVVLKDENQVKGCWDNTTSEVNKALAKHGLPPLLDW